MEYYYGDFRFRGRPPWPKRELDSSLAVMKRIDIEEQISVWASLAKDAGFTGLSIRHRLHPLRGLNVLLDTVYDAMHNFPLNVVSHHLYRYLDREILPKSALEERERQYHGCQVAVNNTDLHMYLHHACMYFTLCGYWFNYITVKIVHNDKDQSNCTLYITIQFIFPFKITY